MTFEPSAEYRPYRSASAGLGIDPALGIFNIDHLIFIVQENRSFDSYFGTYPGADGIPKGVCLRDPKVKACRRPYHDKNLFFTQSPAPPLILDPTP